MNLNYTKAKEEMLIALNEDCQHFFVQNGYMLESGYFELLNNRPQNAEELFSKISAEDIRAHWGAFIATLVQGNLHGYPSYFELRNFFEIDFNLFLKHYLGEYIENIIKYTDWLCTINPEVFKFLGRVFLNNGYDEYGMFFLKRAKDYFYTDPELHYLLAETYYKNGDKKNAKKSLKSCLEILPAYYPAIALERVLEN